MADSPERSLRDRLLESQDVDSGATGRGKSKLGAGRPEGRWCPLEDAGIWSRLTFSFCSRLIGMGYKTPLQVEHLWDVPKAFEAAPVCRELENSLQATKEAVKRPQGAIGWAIIRAYWWGTMLNGFVLLLDSAVQLASPLLLQRLLKAVNEGQSSGSIVALTAALTAVQLSATIFNAMFWFWSLQISAKVRAALRMLLFQKALKLSVAARTSTGVGAIVNLTANDADRISDMTYGINLLWNAPLEIVLLLGVLVWLLGWVAVAAGIGVLIVAVPVAAVITWLLSIVRVKLLACTDSRVKLISEIVQGIKALKLYAWERAFQTRVEKLRSKELFFVRCSALLESGNSVLFWGVPLLVQAAVFSAFTLSGGNLTPALAFPALALLNQLALPLFFLPDQIGTFVQGRVSLGRIQAFLDEPEMQQPPLQPPAAAGAAAVSVKQGVYSWGPGMQPTLQNINLELQRGQLLVVVGAVGAGKSSLLAAVMGEMSTSASIAGTSAYTAQDPWIQNMTVRENILMGRPFDEHRYNAVIETCALRQDLATLPAGDRAEIGEKGLNVSGGQKHRIALARACYQDADVYLLDDPLSAVDAHVGQHLMSACICGLLKDKTRILVTHQLQFLPSADLVMVLNEGHIEELGAYQALLDKGVEFKQFVMPSDDDSDFQADGSEDHDALSAPRHSRAFSDVSVQGRRSSIAFSDADPHADGTAVALPGGHADSGKSPMKRALSRKHSKRPSIDRRKSMEKRPPIPAENGVGDGEGRLIEDEERAVGRVDRQLYLKYFRSWGPLFILPAILGIVQISNQAVVVVQNWWLSQWANKGSESEVSGASLDTRYYLKIYVALGLAGVAAQGVFAVVMALGSVRAARYFHHNLFSGLLRLPMSFFDSQPSGRLMNRFTKDTQACDLTLIMVMQDVIDCLGGTFAGLVITTIVSPLVVIAYVPVVALFEAIRRRYIACSRELKRLDSLAVSPVLSTFTETLQGLMTVRAFRQQGAQAAKQAGLLQTCMRISLPLYATNRWLGVRIEGMGALLVCIVALTCTIILPRSAGLAGLAIANSLDIALMANWVLRQLSETEIAMNSVERMVDYVQGNEPEAPAVVEDCRPPADWPSAGDVQVSKLVIKYRPDLPTVLKGLTFHVHPGHKVGVAGRTGCGKSTLMMALFRVVEAHSGSITIDGIDIRDIGLFDLRSRLALVPQDPVIFSGSVRTNLDPYGAAQGDAAIWEALERAGIKPAINALQGGLDGDMAEGGGNLSTGQRQLLCMARALLRRTRVLVLDEATSNVDTASDALIQETVRTAFRQCTVLTVAHRLHTILDSDRVLVLDAGHVKEYAAPRRLLQDSSSAFSALVAETESALASSLHNQQHER